MDLTPIIIAIIASTGFWTFLSTLYQLKSKNKSAERILLLGLARAEIIRQGNEMISSGDVSPNDYKDYEEFCNAYLDLGGNGGGKAKFDEVKEKVHIL